LKVIKDDHINVVVFYYSPWKKLSCHHKTHEEKMSDYGFPIFMSSFHMANNAQQPLNQVRIPFYVTSKLRSHEPKFEIVVNFHKSSS
jgi:hypothetical protein